MPARGAGPVAAVEPLEQTRAAPPPRRRGRRRRPRARPGARRSVRVARARVPDRVLGEVLGDDLQHPAAERQVDLGLRLDTIRRRPAPRCRRAGSATSSSTGSAAVEPERHDLAAALQLGEEEHVVHELASSPRPPPAPGQGGRRGRLRAEPAVSSSTSSRASGVRSSCDTAAVNADAKLLVRPRILHLRRVWPRS